MSKSSAVIEMMGGDGGGHMREFNVLKRLRVSEDLVVKI